MNYSVVFSEIFNAVFLSPLIFIALFAASSFFTKGAKPFFISFAALFYLLSTGFAAKALLGSLENEFRKAERVSFRPNAVVVLGGGANAYASDSKLSASGYKRFMEGFMLAKKMNVPLIFTGGGRAKENGVTEAEAACETAERASKSLNLYLPTTAPKAPFGDEFFIVCEDKSLNTVQNAKNTMEIMNRYGIASPKIVLVTSAFHMKRSKIIFSKAGFTLLPQAVDFKSLPTPIGYRDALPEFKNLENNYIAIKEYIGMLAVFLLK